jgi:L,D-peptidoglycan transpeptidase YkuD (ErfK/YbiS/YcfS/YnhG family)
MPDTRIPAFEATSGGRLRWQGHDVRCALGRGGVVAADLKREGDGATPLGIWPLRQVFWRPDRLATPETGLQFISLTPAMGWCDDPHNLLYNRPVTLPFPAGHEKLWREDDVYDLIVSLGYNDDPAIAGKGSAIFLHVARPDYSPTEGCIACAREDLLDLLKTANAGDALAIVR